MTFAPTEFNIVGFTYEKVCQVAAAHLLAIQYHRESQDKPWMRWSVTLGRAIDRVHRQFDENPAQP
jgi:hypothetical protein